MLDDNFKELEEESGVVLLKPTVEINEALDESGALEGDGEDEGGVLDMLSMDVDVDDDVRLEMPLLTTDSEDDVGRMTELEVELNVVLIHLMLSKLPLLSEYSYWEHGFELTILTLLTYAVNGTLVKSV